MSSEATMAAYLMESGWKLHLSANPKDGHKIFKCETAGSKTTVRSCDISADAVLELQQSGRLKRERQFTVGHKKTTVFVLSE